MIGATHLGIVLQDALLGALLESVRRGNAAATANAVLAFGIAVSPVMLEAASAVYSPLPGDVRPELTIWISAAGFLHVLGMLGLYESTWWWDHLTHTVSAALVAALVYAGSVVVIQPSGQDTAYDLGFDLVGALLVVAIDVRVFVPIARHAPGTTRTALLGGGAIVLVGSLLVASLLRLSGAEPAG